MLRDRGIIENISELVDIVLIATGFSLAIDIYRLKHVLDKIWPETFVIFFIYLITWMIGSNVYKIYQSRRYMSAWRELRQMLKAHCFAFATASFFTMGR